MAKRTDAAVPVWDSVRSRWDLRVQVDGVRKRFTSVKPGRAGERAVLRARDKWLAGIDPEDQRIRDIWPGYLADLAARRGDGSNAYRSADQIGRVNILPELGPLLVSRLTEQKLQALLNTARKIDGAPYSKKTVRNIRAELVAFCKYLRKAGLIDWRPLDLEIPFGLEIQEKNVLDVNDAAVLLRDQSLDPYLFAWQFMLLYGLRPGEVYGLKWSDITGDSFTINRALNSRRVITPGKNKNARRVEYIFPLARAVLDRAAAWQRAMGMVTPWIFPGENADLMWHEFSVRRLHAYCANNGLPDITPYRLRHTFVSLLKSVLTEAQMKAVVGHSDAMDTLGVYGHTLEQDHIDTGRALAGFFDTLVG